MSKTITLSPFFINHIKATVKPHWGKLGWVTYKRTYARWLDDKDRYETWVETVKRVVEGNINLDPRLKHNPSQKVLNEDMREAEKLFEMIYGLSAVPSGRNLWISGTKYQKRTGDALNNCWFVDIKPQKYGKSHIVPFYASANTKLVSMPFIFAFDELMKGGGVGFSSRRENLIKIPTVKRPVNLTIIISEQSKSFDASHELGAISKEIWLKNNEPNVDNGYYELPDTREGWALAAAYLIDSHFMRNANDNLVLNMSNIRPYGAKIHGFGGTAAGPMPLISMLFSINKVLNRKEKQHLNAVDTTDIMNLIGKAVVAGNVRRSAEMALGSNDDQDFIKMKQDQKQLMDHRWASNNSIAIDSKFDNYKPVAEGILKNGEPGIFNLELSKNYGRIIDGYNPQADPDVSGTNPCFSYETLIKTSDGYQEIGKLAKTGNAELINDLGKKSYSKVWCSGNKKTLIIETNQNDKFECTPDHRFMTEDGYVEAKDLLGRKLQVCRNDAYKYANPTVISIKLGHKVPVYDFTEPNTHAGIVKSEQSKYGIVVHNCGEISLANGEPCNLFDVFPYVAEKQHFDLNEAFKLATRYAKRVTFSNYDWQVSRDIIKKHRRIGVSISGIQDFVIDHFGHRIVKSWQGNKPIYYQDVIDTFNHFFKDVLQADKEYSKVLHCNESIKHTTVKPSGTVAKLAGISEGMHFHYAGYMIQRIRFQDTDPLLKALAACGYHMEPDVYTKNTTCVEFPLKAPHADDKNFASAGTVSMKEQLATQAFLQTYWSDNAVSCTVTFQKQSEGKEIGKWLKAFAYSIKSTSMLPYYGAGLTQAPKEPIAKEDYEARLSNIHGNVEQEYNKQHDIKDLGIVGQQDCAGGACPIK